MVSVGKKKSIRVWGSTVKPYLHIEEIRIDIRIHVLKECVGGDQSLFQHHYGLDHASQPAGALEVTNISFDGSPSMSLLVDDTKQEEEQT